MCLRLVYTRTTTQTVERIMKTIPVANVVGAKVGGSMKFGKAPLGFKAKGVLFGSIAGVAIVFLSA